MELQLTNVSSQIKSYDETRELEVGLEVEYYGVNNKWLKCPEFGEIENDDNGFYINWYDGYKTRIDGSKTSNLVLKNCGFC